jgi:hypothetical protein
VQQVSSLSIGVPIKPKPIVVPKPTPPEVSGGSVGSSSASRPSGIVEVKQKESFWVVNATVEWQGKQWVVVERVAMGHYRLRPKT